MKRGIVLPALHRRVFWALVLGTALLVGSLSCRPAWAASVGHYKARVAGVYVNVVEVNLRDPSVHVEPLVVSSGAGRASFHEFVRHHHPIAAINGTFFDTCTDRVTGNVAVDGRLVCEGYVGNAIAFDDTNTPHFIANTGHMGHHTDWRRYQAALGGGPTLLVNGRLALHPRQEGFHDPGLFRLTRRSAVGYTADGKLLLVTVTRPVDFHRLAYVMRSLHCTHAISLDGGSSTGMYYRGHYYPAPHRELTNVLAVFKAHDGGHSAARRPPAGESFRDASLCRVQIPALVP